MPRTSPALYGAEGSGIDGALFRATSLTRYMPDFLRITERARGFLSSGTQCSLRKASAQVPSVSAQLLRGAEGRAAAGMRAQNAGRVDVERHAHQLLMVHRGYRQQMRCVPVLCFRF